MKLIKKFLMICLMWGITTVEMNQKETKNNEIIEQIQYSETLKQLIDESRNDVKKYETTQKKKSFTETDDIGDDIILMIEVEEKYNKITEVFNDELLSLEEMQQQLKIQRDEVKRFYTMQKEDIIDRLGISEYNYYSSNYTSFIQLKFDDVYDFIDHESEITEIVNNDEIHMAYADINAEYESTAAVDNNTVRRGTYNLQSSFSEVGVLNPDGTRHTNFDGAGINIGIYEVDKPNWIINFAENIVARYTLNNAITTHANIVSTILGGTYGIATQANYFLISSNYTSDTISCMDWFIENNVNVVNASRGVKSENAGKYLAYDKYFDELIHDTHISFVTSAGNEGSSNAGKTSYLTSPALAINAITVGSIDVDHEISNFSSYKVRTGVSSHIAKPTLVAPGGSLIDLPNIENPVVTEQQHLGHSGTSFAAPHVTGVVALLMQEFPELISKPYLVRSALVCGAQQLPSQISTWDTQAGAGLLNYRYSRTVLTNHWTYCAAGAKPTGQISGVFAKQNVFLPAGNTINVWTSWDTAAFFSGSILASEKHIEDTPQVYRNTLSLATGNAEPAYYETGQPFVTENSRGNIIGLKYTNNGNSRYVQIQVALDGSRVQASPEYGAVCYNIISNSTSSSSQNSKIISKHDYGFEQQYFFEEKNKDISIDELTFATSRLRAGYISKEYVVMSPRKVEAGLAYLHYNFQNPVYRANVDLTLWSDSELLRPSDCTAVVQYKDADGNWITILDLLNDIQLSVNRQYPTTFVLDFATPILEFRFYSTAPQIGASSNTGRLCIGDMKVFYTIPI